jgi:hypothetical protein
LRVVLHQRLVREALRPIFRWLDGALGGCAITVIARRVEEVSGRERGSSVNVEEPPCE